MVCSNAVGVAAGFKMHVAVLQQAKQIAEIADGPQTLQLLGHVALLPAAVTSPHLQGESHKEAKQRLREHSTHALARSDVQLHASLCLDRQLSPYPVVQHSVLGHAVGFTELLHSASIVAVQHLQAEARAVRAGAPGMDVVTRRQLVPKEQLTV